MRHNPRPTTNDNLSWANNSLAQAGQDVVGLGSHMSCMSCLNLHFGLPVQPEWVESTCMEYHHTIFNLDSSLVLTHITIGPHRSKSPRQQDEPLALCATANTSSRVDAQLRHSSLRTESQSEPGDTIPVSWNNPSLKVGLDRMCRPCMQHHWPVMR